MNDASPVGAGGQTAPAFTKEEWFQYGTDRAILRDLAAGKRPFGPQRRFSPEEKLHVTAALALYGQPFGFTHADIRQLLDAANREEQQDPSAASALRSIADRIAALLPPEGVRPLGTGSG